MTTATTASEQRGDEIAPKKACPTCGEKGRRVQRVTLESLLRPERRGDIGEDQYYVCATPRCDTVYFGVSNSQTFRKSDLTVRFGLKETDAPRHVCYCFDHTVEEIHDEIHRTGESTVVESIKADMKGPGCRCEHTNPLGGCCLKTVQVAVANALRSLGNEEQAAAAEAIDHGDCCAGNGHARKDEEATADCCVTPRGASTTGAGRDRAGALAAGGSVVAAILSSACCWLPLVLIAFGASAAGVAGFFDAYRPYFITGAMAMLGIGFYTVYFRRETCATNSACAGPNRRLRAFSRIMLWTATGLVGVFGFFPNYVGYLFAAPTSESALTPDVRLATAKFRIEGMTCDGCATGLRATLAKLPDVVSVEVDYPTKTAEVRYDADSPGVDDEVIEAVKAAGYDAALTDDP